MATLSMKDLSKRRISMDIMLVFVFVLAVFLGIELISKVPSQLHTPLMSGTNAISGITIVGICNNKCCRWIPCNR